MASQKNNFYVEAKVKEWNKNNNITIDRVKGNADDVIIILSEKYSSKRLKKGLFKKIGHAFNIAGEEMEDMIKKGGSKR